MPDTRPAHGRRVIDTVMLVAVALCLVIAFSRVALAAATVPYAAYVNQREAAPGVTIAERVAASGPFVSWWGGRRIPYREGGDYLGVISKHSTARALGCLIGVLAERERARGVTVDRVIVPVDRVALYGGQSGTPMTKADGTQVRTAWGSLANDSSHFSDVPVVQRTYAPVLSAEQTARINAEADLVKQTRDFYIGAPAPGGSGTWVLYVMERERREFVLIPIESSPLGGAR